MRVRNVWFVTWDVENGGRETKGEPEKGGKQSIYHIKRLMLKGETERERKKRETEGEIMK